LFVAHRKEHRAGDNGDSGEYSTAKKRTKKDLMAYMCMRQHEPPTCKQKNKVRCKMNDDYLSEGEIPILQ
jgi:hypothetical protein